MTEPNFAAAIKKLTEAPADQVFESAFEMFKSIQSMNEDEVVAFWRAARMFWEQNPRRNTTPPPAVRHLLETAWARMDYLRSIGSMGDECVQIEHLMQAYSKKKAA